MAKPTYKVRENAKFKAHKNKLSYIKAAHQETNRN